MKKLFLFLLLFPQLLWAPPLVPEQGGFDVLLPMGYSYGKKYPVVFLLPPDKRTSHQVAEVFLRKYSLNKEDMNKEDMQQAFHLFSKNLGSDKQFLMILPKGTGDSKKVDYTKATEDIVKIIKQIKNNYSIDEQRIILSGFSLGGDLSLGISLIKPTMFRGAVIMGSRCKYPLSKDSLNDMKRTNFRMYLTMGKLDDRLKDMEKAKEKAVKYGIKTEMKILENLGHTEPEPEVFAGGLKFVLE